MNVRLGILLAMVLGITTAASAVAQEAPVAPGTPIAVVLRVATGPLLELDGKPDESASRKLAELAGDLEAWREPDVGFPFTLAISPVMCDELGRADTTEARRLLSLLRGLARRSEVLTAPYADVRLPYLRSQEAIREELERGARSLRECLGRAPIDVLMPPGLALDERAVEAARGRSIDASISDLTGTPVRSRPTVQRGPITLIPPVEASGFNTRRAAGALVVDAGEPSWASSIATAEAAGEVDAVPIAQLARDVPEVLVGFPDSPRPNDARRQAIDRARRVLAGFEDYTMADNVLGDTYRIAYARALATTSDEWHEQLNDPKAGGSRGRQVADRLVAAIRDEGRKLTAAGEAVLFTSRRGSFGITVANRADYPVRVRVSVSSPKLEFPDGSSRVVTIEPPGGPIEFAAITRSSGTFPTLFTLTSPDRSVVFDRGDLSVRSTTVNFSAIVLTAGGAVFLFGWIARRRARRRSSAA